MNTVEPPQSMRTVVPSELKETFRRSPGGVFSYLQYGALLSAIKASPEAFSDLPELRVAIVRNFTLEAILPILAGEIVAAGFRPEFFIGDFDSAAAEVLDEGSDLFAFRPDFVILADWLEGLNPTLVNRFMSLSPAQVADAVETVRRNRLRLLTALRQRTKAIAITNNFPLPPFPTLGILDAQQVSGQSWMLLDLNRGLAEDSRAVPDAYIVDLHRKVAEIGYVNAVDARYWQMARAPLSQAGLIAYGRECGRIFRALRGRSRKCLVLDCDNTLWGGIVGEDGIEGIKIDTTYPGSSYAALQEEILNLYDRGILLALCSKNNEADVLTVLREHPGMVIREEHLAIMMVNWDDKVTNLRRIAKELNIGLDSLVFVDDNPFEINFVSEQLPEVATILLTGTAAHYRVKLASSGLFDSLSLSEEDKLRTQLYRSDRQRVELHEASSSLEDYLASLNTQADLRHPTKSEVSRVAQLTQKTNQFNLTTKRYGEGEIAALNESGDSEIIRLSAADKVSNLGLVGVAILRYQGETAEIDSLVMSCRALGRGLETAFLHTVIKAARKRGVSSVTGAYLPTAKNNQCADFYQRNGFSKVEERPTGVVWQLASDSPLPPAPAWVSISGEINSDA